MDELEKRDKAISELIKRNKELKASGRERERERESERERERDNQKHTYV